MSAADPTVTTAVEAVRAMEPPKAPAGLATPSTASMQCAESGQPSDGVRHRRWPDWRW